MKNIRNIWNFAVTYPGWHVYSNDRATKNAIKWLLERNLIEVNTHNQFKARILVSTDVKIAIRLLPTYETIKKHNKKGRL